MTELWQAYGSYILWGGALVLMLLLHRGGGCGHGHGSHQHRGGSHDRTGRGGASTRGVLEPDESETGRANPETAAAAAGSHTHRRGGGCH